MWTLDSYVVFELVGGCISGLWTYIYYACGLRCLLCNIYYACDDYYEIYMMPVIFC